MAQKKYLSLERLQEYDALIKQEIVDSVSGKANSSHTHDDRYYTETEIDNKIAAVNTSISNITGGTTVVKEAEHATTADSATKADSATTATTADTANAVAWANVTGKPSTYAPSSHNHDDRYYTETEVDELLSGKADSGHNHDTKYDAKGAAATAESNAKTYADNAATKVKNDLLNGAGTAYDTLKELGDLIDDNQDAIEALETVASGKADAVHSHAIADVTGLQSALDGKAASSHGTHVTFDSTNKPKMDGTAAFGTSTNVARADHVHPTDTSRASKTEFDTHASDTTKHITSTERTNWGTAYTHSQAAHAPSNAEKNIIIGIQKNGTDLTVNSSTRKVNITVPTTAADIGAAASSHTHAISDITNLQTTLNNASSAISANTSSINTHTDKITALENKVGDGFEEITSAEIQALFAAN